MPYGIVRDGRVIAARIEIAAKYVSRFRRFEIGYVAADEAVRDLI